jgi:hypothetical protein
LVSYFLYFLFHIAIFVHICISRRSYAVRSAANQQRPPATSQGGDRPPALGCCELADRVSSFCWWQPIWRLDYDISRYWLWNMSLWKIEQFRLILSLATLLLIRDIQVLLEMLFWFSIICPELLLHYEDICTRWLYLVHFWILEAKRLPFKQALQGRLLNGWG